MRIIFIGLGKMGFFMAKRLLKDKHKVHAYNRSPEATKKLVRSGAKGIYDLSELSKFKGQKIIWIMVPHQEVESVIKEIDPHIRRGDIIIDGGNSPYKLAVKRSSKLKKKGISYIDVGVSGGLAAAKSGYCLMVGGERKSYNKMTPLLKSLSVPKGYNYMGKSGAGHFVKMIHNGIEYGMMQSIAEGFDLMKESSYELKLKEIADLYSHGSIIESKLMRWMRDSYEEFGENLKGVSGSAAESGEGAWTTQFAHQIGIPDKVIHESLYARRRTRKKPSYQGKVIGALRNAFGGHSLKGDKKK